jgi:hypothetical protein
VTKKFLANFYFHSVNLIIFSKNLGKNPKICFNIRKLKIEIEKPSCIPPQGNIHTKQNYKLQANTYTKPTPFL